MSVITGKCSSCGKYKMNPNCERCRFVWLINQAANLRMAQKKYFATGKVADMGRAREYESLIDSALDRIKEVHEQTSFDFGANV